MMKKNKIGSILRIIILNYVWIRNPSYTFGRRDLTYPFVVLRLQNCGKMHYNYLRLRI